jgi:hypothetical protein
MSGAHILSERGGEEKISLLLPGIETRSSYFQYKNVGKNEIKNI